MYHPVGRAMVPQTRVVVSSVSSAMMTSLPSVLTSVHIFDGSQITDGLVVSNRFWSTLSSNLTQLLVAQFLASVCFVAIASLVTAQGKFIMNVIDDNSKVSNGKADTRFWRANDPPPPTLDFTKLLVCIGIDMLGSANEAIPLAGEFVDVIYAPIAALLLRQLFSGSNIVALLEFVEEILPFTDVLPLATVCWIVESFFGSGSLACALRIGEFASNG